MADSGDLWSHKPWWCQPWSILLTGVVLVGGSWWWLRLWWLSLPLADKSGKVSMILVCAYQVH